MCVKLLTLRFYVLFTYKEMFVLMMFFFNFDLQDKFKLGRDID